MPMRSGFASFLLGFVLLGCGRDGGSTPPGVPSDPGSSGSEAPPPGDRSSSPGGPRPPGDGEVDDSTVPPETLSLVAPEGVRPRPSDVADYALGPMPPWSEVASEAALEHPVPYQLFPHVPGRVVGVLVMAGHQPYGSPFGHAGEAPFDDQPTDRDEYRFGFSGSSPYAQYFPSRGEGFNYLPNWSVPIDAERTLRVDAAMFDFETPNPWGLVRRAHLVEIEVNGGAGGEGVHFIVTSARVLDGTPTFPPRLDALLTAMHDDFVTSTQPAVHDAMATFEQAVRTHPEARFTPMQTRLALHPTYHAADRTIDVLFRREIVMVGMGPARAVVQQCPYCPPGAPCVRCDPHTVDVRDRTTVSFLVSARYVVDASGRVRMRTRSAPHASSGTAYGSGGLLVPSPNGE